MLTGGCHCGEVRYNVEGRTTNRAICHCTICRRTTGAPMVAWFSAAKKEFQLLRGQLTAYRARGFATRRSCARCGTQTSFEDDNLPEEIDVTTCSLDEPDTVAPDHHIFAARRLRWSNWTTACPPMANGRAVSSAGSGH
ncbi:MAG: GFA family protein [Rhodospirillaceae bacterium]